MDVIMLEGKEVGTLVDTLMAMRDLERAEIAADAARLAWMLARRMVREANGDDAALVADCARLLGQHNPDPENLTPDVLAERFKRVAELPKAAEVMSDGRIFLAAVTDPNKNGEVWCELPICDACRAGLAKAYATREGVEPTITVPGTTTPQ